MLFLVVHHKAVHDSVRTNDGVKTKAKTEEDNSVTCKSSLDVNLLSN